VLLIDFSRAELTSTNLVGLDGHFQTTVYAIQFHSGHQQTVHGVGRGNLGRMPVSSVRRTSSKPGEKQRHELATHGSYVERTTQRRSSHLQQKHAAAAAAAAAAGERQCSLALATAATRRSRCGLFTPFTVSVIETPRGVYQRLSHNGTCH